MENTMSLWIQLSFMIIFLIAATLFFLSNKKLNKVFLVVIVLWCILQSALALNGFYFNSDTIPPRFLLVLLPPLTIIIFGFLPKQIEAVSKYRNLNISTALHTIRIPIEIVLYFLFVEKYIPKSMTFHGQNFDILIGISAPIMAYLFYKKKIGKKVLIVWNVIGLCFVLNIFSNAILSSELPIQQFNFEQPNRAINYFPFILLPAFVVPMVIYTHISDIIILIKKRKLENE